jgi:hypothetical protein
MEKGVFGYSRRSQKFNFRRKATNLFLAVATVCRNMLIFFFRFLKSKAGSLLT